MAATCASIAAFKPDLVVTEKGLSDLAAHFLTKARNPRVGVFRGCFMRVYLLLWVCGLFGCEQGDRLGAGSHP